MKNLSTLCRILTMLFLLLVYSCVQAIAQTPVLDAPFDPGTTSGEVFTWYTGIYGAVITAVTYVQGAFFKNSTWIPNTAIRYVLIAAVAAALFISMGWVNALQVFIGFIGAALAYDKVLKPLGLKTPSMASTTVSK